MISRRTYVLNGIALIALLALTAYLATVHLGVWSTPVALVIAIAKALLVVTFFMELKISPRLIWLVAGMGLFWFLILAVAVWTDVVTRVPIVPR